MTTQPRTNASIPVRPFAFLFVLMLGIAIGVVAGRWQDRDSTTSGAVTRPDPGGALGSSFPAPPLSAADQAAYDIAVHGDAFPVPVFSVPAEVRAVQAAITPTYDDLVALAVAQHSADFPALESAPAPAVLAPTVIVPPTFEEQLTAAIAEHEAHFPALSALTPSIIVAPSVEEQLATALAEHDAYFPPLAAPGSPSASGR